MEVPNLLPLVEQLDDNVDDLEESLEPILSQSLTEASKKLPVLDKAKLHVLTTYALESLIFSYLRLHGVDAKQHPVFRELTRVRQYFDKIKALETEPEQRTMAVDKQAAGRFIKHGLAGNERFDMERKEQEAKSKARAQFKAAALAKRAERSERASQAKDGPNDDAENSEDSDEENMDAEPTHSAQSSEPYQSQSTAEKNKRKAKREAKAAKQHGKSASERKESKKERRERKLEKRKARKIKEKDTTKEKQ